MRKKQFLRPGITALAAILMAGSLTFAAKADVTLGSGSESYRINVLNAIGVSADLYNTEDACKRAEFAELMVLSSTYKDTANTTLTSAAANDVPSTYSGAQYIKTALINGWMRTRLGGNFSPESPVTLNDVAKATLTALGYTDSDFTSNVSQERLSLFKSLELDDGISASVGSDTLTKKEAINVIYNLLRTKKKDSTNIYGSDIDLTLSSDNELNATSVIENSLTGPVLVKSVTELSNALPFDLDDATYYYNGQNSGSYGERYIESQIRSNGWCIIYYNENTKTLWAYGTDSTSGIYNAVYGKVTSILYEDDNIAAPSAVYIDSVKYTLSSSDVKFMFSLNGDIQVGDYCVLICNDKSDSLSDDSESDWQAVAVCKWTANTDGTRSGTIIATDAGHYTSGSSSSSSN